MNKDSSSMFAGCRVAHKVIRICALVLLTTGLARAQLVIGPLAVEFAPQQRVAAVSVRLDENAKVPVRLQAEVLRWTQNLAGDAVTEETDDLLVTPPIVDVLPGQRQVFRLALRGNRPAPEELAYRLILEDVTESSGATEISPGMTINFRVRHDLPVVLAPIRPVRSSLRWKICPPDSKQLVGTTLKASSEASPPVINAACVRLLNDGNRRVKVQTLTLSGDGWQQVLSLKEGENVLAGTEREWRVPLAPGQSGATLGVKVDTARGETLQAEAGGF